MPRETDKTVLRAHLSVRWKTLFFPVPPLLLARALPSLKYVLPDDVLKWEGIRPNIEIEGGVVGRKGSIAVQISPERNYISVHSRDLSVLETEFSDVEDLMLDELQFDSRSNAWFYEIVASFSISTNADPVEAWHSSLGNVPFVKSASQIIGTDVAPYGLRLTTTNANPNQVDWTDIKVEPTVQAASSRYTMDIIFRREDRNEVINFMRRTPEVGDSLVTLVEAGD